MAAKAKAKSGPVAAAIGAPKASKTGDDEQENQAEEIVPKKETGDDEQENQAEERVPKKETSPRASPARPPATVDRSRELALATEHPVTGPRAWDDKMVKDSHHQGDCEEYFQALLPSVLKRLTAYLERDPTVGGLGLKGPLYEQPPLDVSKAERNAALKSFKEKWSKQHCQTCQTSLDASGVYEAPATNGCWLDPTERAKFSGKQVPGTVLTWSMLDAGRKVWSDEKLHKSSTNPAMQHFTQNWAIVSRWEAAALDAAELSPSDQ